MQVHIYRARTARLAGLLALCLLAVALAPRSGPGPGLFPPGAAAQTTAAPGSIFGLVGGGVSLVNFNPLTPASILRTLTITGLGSGETITGIDYRPRTGQLYGVSSASRIYTINTTTGAVTAVGTAITPALTGADFGVDFNPVPDRIRLVSDADINLRLHPDTGVIAGTDTALAYATGDPNVAANPNVNAVAYTSNFEGATSTTLYGIDTSLDILVRHGSAGGTPVSPNAGQLFTIGALGVATDGQIGLDIGAGDLAYAALTPTGSSGSSLYRLNLTTGAATLGGAIGANLRINDMTIVTSVPSLVVTNAASFATDGLAPDSIVSIFGPFRPSGTTTAPAGPLPTTLGGITVRVGGVAIPLMYVSSTQINALLPSTLPDGPASVVVTNNDNVTTNGALSIVRAAPGIFTTNGVSGGVALALTTTNGASYRTVYNTDGSARDVDAGTAAAPNFLVLYVTGLRNAPLAGVSATIQGVPAEVGYAGPSGFTGVDQVNLRIPPELAGFGLVRIRLTAAGRSSNLPQIRLGGQPPLVRQTPLNNGETVIGALSTDDQVQDAGDGSARTHFFDAYSFTVTAPTSVAVALSSPQFDAAVALYQQNTDGGLTLLAVDDQTGALGNGQDENGNALLLTTLPRAGNYVVFATTADRDANGTGGYQLRMIQGVIQPIAYGASVSGTIDATDLATSAGDYLDAYSFNGVARDVVSVTMTSTAFDSFLILNRDTGELQTYDDNTGGGQNARIFFTLPASGTYIVIATPFAPGRTGAYTLNLTRAGVPSGPPMETGAAEEIVEPARPGRGRMDTETAGRLLEQFSMRRIVIQN
ncbi:MAG: DUF4394 domain-containing protein [Blastocatellia bacterium]